MSASVAPPRGLLGARGAGLPRPSRPSTALNAVQRSTFRSPADGYGLEVLSAAPAKATSAPPVLFVHGSGHGAWCWAQRFMPYLEGRGFESHAVSLRGQGESDPVAETEALTLDVHSRDLADFIATLRSPPVIVGHSFGGLIVQDYARDAGSKHPPIR